MSFSTALQILNNSILRVGRNLISYNDPDFIIIGAQKCGTSSLHAYLEQHSEIEGSIPKEIHFFDRDIYLGKKLNSYRRHFLSGTNHLCFESSPSYLYAPGAAQNIYKYYPEIKLIVILRDPVKRAFSAWNHYKVHFETGTFRRTISKGKKRKGNLINEKFFKDRASFPDFRECIEIELELIELGTGFEPAILRRGLYLSQLQEYWRLFSKEKLMIIGFQDLIKNPAATMGEITSFLETNKFDWENVEFKPQNQNYYKQSMGDDDKFFLDAFYNEPNKKLFDEIGALNW